MAKYKKEQSDKEADAKRKTSSDIKMWLDKIDVSKRYREKVAERYRWKILTDEYRGDFKEVQNASDIYIPPLNFIFAYVKSEIPSLYLRDPKIKVNAKKGTSHLAARILEKALNYLWRTKRIKRENKKNILDVLLVGHSWFKTGYAGKFGAVEEANGNTYEFIESEDFFGYRVPYKDITFNPDANDPPYDCTWIAHEVCVPLADIQKSKLYKNTKDLKPSITGEYDLESKDPVNDDKRHDLGVPKARLYEVWDKSTRTVFTIAEGCDHYLKEPQPWPYDMNGFPFSYLRINEDPMCPYGIPDCYMFEPQVLEIMKIRAMMLDHLKRFNRQLLISQGSMGEEAKSHFAAGITGAVIEVNTGGKPLGDVAVPTPYPQIQTDIYAIEDRLTQDTINISGQAPSERGASQKTTTRTFKELVEIKKGAENRRSDKIDTIEDFVEDAASNLVALLQQLADIPYFVRIADDDPEKVIEGLQSRQSAGMEGAVTNGNGFTFTKEDIAGEFDFEVVAGSTKPLDQEQKLSLIVSLFEMLPSVGVMPGGPVYKYLGNEFADELDLGGLKKAIEEEQALAEERAQKQAEQAAQDKQLMVATETADIQLKAEREATRQNETLLKGMQLFKEGKEKKDGEV